MRNKVRAAAAISLLVVLAGCSSAPAERPAAASFGVTPEAANPTVNPDGTVARIQTQR